MTGPSAGDRLPAPRLRPATPYCKRYRMCTLALYFSVFENYSVVVAANRDEYYARPSALPHAIAERPVVFGGKDLEAGGTWLGVNEHALLVGVLNRRLEHVEDRSEKRSRGLLCLDVLGAENPDRALQILRRHPGSAYRPFNLLIASAERCYVAYNLGDAIDVIALNPGLHVLSNASVFDPRSEKLDTAFGLFSEIGRKAGENAEFFLTQSPDGPPPCLASFRAALSSHRMFKTGNDPRGAICVHAGPYGTVSSSVVVLAAREKRFDYYHAPAAPCRSAFEKCASVDVV
jgi:hypothetical protein